MYGRGHAHGTRKQQPRTSTWWYQSEECAALLAQLDADAAAKAAQTAQTQQTHQAPHHPEDAA
jgi:hypothetical protein